MADSKNNQTDPKHGADPKTATDRDTSGKAQRDDQPLKKMNDDPEDETKSNG